MAEDGVDWAAIDAAVAAALIDPEGDPLIIRQGFRPAIRQTRSGVVYSHEDELYYVAHWANGETREMFSVPPAWRGLVNGFVGDEPKPLEHLQAAVEAKGRAADAALALFRSVPRRPSAPVQPLSVAVDRPDQYATSQPATGPALGQPPQQARPGAPQTARSLPRNGFGE
ncbi:MAG: hypothetical protein ABIO40_11395 [Devosia sp.]